MNERCLETITDDKKSNPYVFEDFTSRKKTFRTLKTQWSYVQDMMLKTDFNKWWKMLDKSFIEAEHKNFLFPIGYSKLKKIENTP